MSGKPSEGGPNRPRPPHLSPVAPVSDPLMRDVGGRAGPGSADRGGGDPEILHAWLDRELHPGEAAAVGRRVAADPGLAMISASYRAQADALHALYDGVLDEPVPPPLLDLLRARRAAAIRIARHQLWWNRMVTAAVTLGAAGAVGTALGVTWPLFWLM